MITLVLAALWFATMPPVHRKPHARIEVCPHALYFIRHGEQTTWTKHKRLLCHIGDHDFYGDKR